MTTLKGKCTIVLEDDQSALVLSGDGSLEFYLPEFGDDDIVQEHALLIAAIASRLEDDEGFRLELLDYLEGEISPLSNRGTA